MNKQLAEKVAQRIRESGLMLPEEYLAVVPVPGSDAWMVEFWKSGCTRQGDVRSPEAWSGLATWRHERRIGMVYR